VGAQAATEIRAGGRFGRLPPGADLPRAGTLRLTALPPGFRLATVALSHAASGLGPSCFDVRAGAWHRVLTTPRAGPLTVTVREPERDESHLAVSWGRTPGEESDLAAVRSQLRRALVLDEDISGLYATVADEPGLTWIAAGGHGRLLRSPTVWEDLVRTLAATNASLSRTRAMLADLTDLYGERGPAGERAFPEPSAVARAVADDGPETLRDQAGWGYRAGPLALLAQRVDAGTLDVESWRASSPPPGGSDTQLDDDGVAAAIRALPGFGPVSADSMLGLLGRARGLALDTWARARVGDLAGLGGPADDRAVRNRYARFGRWAGTVCWLEITREWTER
jgi:N-glycosylase/DNA lyase